MKKTKEILAFVRKNPRYIFFVAGVIVQALELINVKVDSKTVEDVLDLVTLIALGRIMKKSEADKLL